MRKRTYGLIAGVMLVFFYYTAKNVEPLVKPTIKTIPELSIGFKPFAFKNKLILTEEDIIGALDHANKVRDLKSRYDGHKETKTISYGSAGLETAFQSKLFIRNTKDWYNRELAAAIKQENDAYVKELKSDSFTEYMTNRKRIVGSEQEYVRCIGEINQETKDEINLENHVKHILINLNRHSIVLHVDEIKVIREGLSNHIKLREDAILQEIQKLEEQRLDSIKNSNKKKLQADQ